MHEIRTAEPAGYAEFLAQLKQRIERAQLRASLAVNRELGPSLLANRSRNSFPAGPPKLGREGHRARRRLKALLPRHAGLLTQESQIHARFRRSLGGGGICASGACTNHLVSQHCPYGPKPTLMSPAAKYRNRVVILLSRHSGNRPTWEDRDDFGVVALGLHPTRSASALSTFYGPLITKLARLCEFCK
jgi:hypothetical protein